MIFKVLTLFPEIYQSLNHSILKKGLESKIFDYEIINIRDFSKDKHKKCDDYPYGGGQGMVLTPQPLDDAISYHDIDGDFFKIYLSPQGEKFDSSMAKKLSLKKKIMLINGAYEGIDQRIIDMHVDLELSIGDYILTSGDYASLVVISTIARYLENMLGDPLSAIDESFEKGLLEYPQYTRPAVYKTHEVPQVLLEGDHKKIEEWRHKQSLLITQEKRPDLF